MADYTGNFDLQLHVSDDNIVIVDTSNYAQSGTLPDGTFRGYIESIISPMGVEVYSNPYNSGNPPAADIDFSVSNKSTTEIEIPKFESGEIQTGNYSITVKIVGGGDTFTSTKLFSFIGYQQPELDLEVLFDCVTPNFSSEDKTNYTTTGDREPETITRLHTIDFPKDGVADLTGTDVKLETGTFYSTTQIVHFESEFYYDFGSDLYIYDKISTPESGFKKEVICISDLCQVYTLVDNLYTKLINARKVSGNPAQIERDWHESVGLLIMIREALNCGNSEGLDAYRERIEKLSGQCDCGCGETDEPVLITGWSSVDNNTVTPAYASDDAGSDFSFTPTGNTAYFAVFAHNKNYTPVVSDYVGLWIPISENLNVGDNIQNVLFDDNTSTFTIVTDQGSYSVQGSKYFDVDNIGDRDALILSAGEIWLRGALVSVDNTTGDPLDPQPRTYRYDGNNVWFEFPEGSTVSQGASLEQDITSNLGEAIGGINDQETIPEGTSFTDFVKKLITKVFFPTFVNPSFSLSDSGANLVEIDSNINFDLTFNFNRGQILGDIVGGVWNPSAEQDKRAGAADTYTIDGTTQAGNVLSVNKTITQGINSYSATVDYLVGVQPKDSAGNNYLAPYPAGTSPSRTATKEGVYPLFATTSSISVATKQALLSMITANNIEKTLVAESGGNKQFFDIPDTWLSSRAITKVEFYNPVSGSFDPTNQLSTFTQSSVTHTIQGNVIVYTRFTNNTADRGATLIKIIF